MNVEIIYQFFEHTQTHNWQYVDKMHDKKTKFFIDGKTAQTEIKQHDLKVVLRSFDGKVLKLVYGSTL